MAVVVAGSVAVVVASSLPAAEGRVYSASGRSNHLR